MSFNDTFTSYRDIELNDNSFTGNGLGTYSGSFTYELQGSTYKAKRSGKFNIVEGIDVTGSNYTKTPSGLACRFVDVAGSQIRIPHHKVFNRFGFCDDWTISFWVKTNGSSRHDVILSKHAVTSNLIYNPKRGRNDLYDGTMSANQFQYQDFTVQNISSTAITGSNIRVPFHISLYSNATSQKLTMEASDGTNNIRGNQGATVIPSVHKTSPTLASDWCHWTVRNSGSVLQIFSNGSTLGSVSGSLPDQPTANEADVTIGNRTFKKDYNQTENVDISEIRMYDYAVSNEGILSLANNNYTAASCYQTNIVGNVFHRNGQVVASSPLPKHNTGSGIFSSERDWNIKWRGVHTIYENQVFVRVPKDVLNVSINPSATFTPPTNGGEVCSTNQNNILPGERRKDLFVSGTLKPYITTIGCYNDEGQMLAVAKMAQPIQKRDDIDMNFVVRWDY
tara:strand:+ start:12 stop:1361 length:1350 start_codon:yes stop_codon:yes gene_type:complete